MTNPAPQILSDASLIDLAVWGIRDNLVNNLSWLNTAYGVVERIYKKNGNRTIVTPEVFAPGVTDTGYLSMTPDEHLNNYCFFVLEDPESSKMVSFGQPYLNRSKISLVFWFDFRKVYTDQLERNINNVLGEVLGVIRNPILTIRNGIEEVKIYRNPDSVYKGFTIDPAKNQKFARPYGSFRLEFNITYDELTCEQVTGGNTISAWSTNDDEVIVTPEDEIISS